MSLEAIMRPINNSFSSMGLPGDNLALTRLLIDLINKYLHETDEQKRKAILAEISQLRDLSAILNKGK